MEALKKEITAKGERYGEYVVSTVFIGGGTPSVVKPQWIGEIMALVRRCFTLAGNAEISMEMNPGTVNEESLALYKAAGINRLSIGLQSARDAELSLLGRIHTFEEFLNAYTSAGSMGFFNINVDLMSALPGQTMESYRETLQRVLALTPPPKHISAYSLIIEEGTPFYSAYERGELNLPSEEEERQMYEETERILKEHGYHRYEISNYAREGYECRHNIGYWTRENYVGFGLGAASLVENKRFTGETDLEAYLENPLAEQEVTVLSREEQMEEFMFLGLRLAEGVEEKMFCEYFGEEIEAVYGDVIAKHVGNGLLIRKEGRIYLSPKGMDVSNYVMSDFLMS